MVLPLNPPDETVVVPESEKSTSSIDHVFQGRHMELSGLVLPQ